MVLLILKNLPTTSEIKLGSALETKAIKNAIKSGELTVTQRAKEVIPLARNILVTTEKTPSKFIDEKQLFKSTERLPEEGVKVLAWVTGFKLSEIKVGMKVNLNAKVTPEGSLTYEFTPVTPR